MQLFRTRQLTATTFYIRQNDNLKFSIKLSAATKHTMSCSPTRTGKYTSTIWNPLIYPRASLRKLNDIQAWLCFSQTSNCTSLPRQLYIFPSGCQYDYSSSFPPSIFKMPSSEYEITLWCSSRFLTRTTHMSQNHTVVQHQQLCIPKEYVYIDKKSRTTSAEE